MLNSRMSLDPFEQLPKRTRVWRECECDNVSWHCLDLRLVFFLPGQSMTFVWYAYFWFNCTSGWFLTFCANI